MSLRLAPTVINIVHDNTTINQVIVKTHAETTHIITNQLQKINNTRFNVVRSPTATYIHTSNY